MEADIEVGFESGLVDCFGLAGKPEFGRQVEQDRQVRPKAIGRDRLERTQGFQVEPGAVPLVGERRVGEAGTDDGDTTVEGGSNDLRDELPAGGIEEEGVGERIDLGGVGRGVQQQIAELLAQLRPAGLSRPDHRHPHASQPRLEPGGLGRLAAAFGPLDRDEPAARGRRSGSCHAAECSGPDWPSA